MDQRSDDIRQDIDETRASLDAKLNTLETKARQTFDLKHHVSEQPWMALGAAVAAGYMLGSLGSNEPEQQTSRYVSQPSSSDSFLAPFDAEIDMLRTAAVTMVTNFLHDVVKEYVPAIGKQFKSAVHDGLTSEPTTSDSYGERASSVASRQSDDATLNNLLMSSTTSDTN